jgi:hypothetical protein
VFTQAGGGCPELLIGTGGGRLDWPETSNSNVQISEKLQTPNFKLQKSLKLQTPKSLKLHIASVLCGA